MEHAKYVPIKLQEREDLKKQVQERFGSAAKLANSIVYNLLAVGTNTGNSTVMHSAAKFVCGLADDDKANSVALQINTVSEQTKSAKFVGVCVDTLLQANASDPAHLHLYAKAFADLAHRDKTNSNPETAAAKVRDIVPRNVSDRNALDALSKQRR